MKKKTYIQPSIEALETTSTEILAGSTFGSGGSGNPGEGRAKWFSFDIFADEDDDEEAAEAELIK